jgi:hypothetical protein
VNAVGSQCLSRTAYRRGDFFEKRKRLMMARAEFCARAAPETEQLLRLNDLFGGLLPEAKS